MLNYINDYLHRSATFCSFNNSQKTRHLVSEVTNLGYIYKSRFETADCYFVHVKHAHIYIFCPILSTISKQLFGCID